MWRGHYSDPGHKSDQPIERLSSLSDRGIAISAADLSADPR